jgi:bacterioferritin
MLKADLGVEVANQGELKTAIALCEEKRDFVSREILEDILDDTEEHMYDGGESF